MGPLLALRTGEAAILLWLLTAVIFGSDVKIKGAFIEYFTTHGSSLISHSIMLPHSGGPPSRSLNS